MKLFSLNAILMYLGIFLIGVLLFKYLPARDQEKYSRQIKQARDRVASLRNSKIPYNLRLLPNNGFLDSNFTSQLEKSENSLVILFEPTQCGACLEEKVMWNEIKASNIIPIYAITYLKDKQELTQYLKDSHTEIAVYQDTLALIGKYLQPRGVPVKLLVNKNHEIILVDYVRRSDKERKSFVNMLNFYLKGN